jgi:hypothetical protein
MRRLRLLLPALLLTAAACGDGGTAPDNSGVNITNDVIVAGSDLLRGDLALLALNEGSASLSVARIGTPLYSVSPQTSASGCTYDVATGRHSCAASAEGQLSVTRSYRYQDAASAAQQAYSPATTAAINFATSAVGQHTGEAVVGSVARSRNVTVSGLAGTETERVWNGSGSDSLDVEVHGATITRRYVMRSTVAVTNVVYGVPRSSNPYPTSGQVQYDVRVTQTADGAQPVSRTATRRVTITFNGTVAVPLTVGMLGCTLYLDTRGVACGQPD